MLVRAGGSGGDESASSSSISTLLTAELLGLCVILFNVLLTFALSALERWAHRSHRYLQASLRVLYRELMVLGLISLGVILVETQVYVDHDLLIAFESAHVFVFLLAIFFSFTVIVSAVSSIALSARWKRLEVLAFDDYQELKIEYEHLKDQQESKSNLFWKWFLWTHGDISKIWRLRSLSDIMSFHDARFQFIYYRKLPESFGFAKFLRKVKAKIFVQLIEVHWTHWAIVLIIFGIECLRRYLFEHFKVSSSVSYWYTFGFRLFTDLIASLVIISLFVKIYKVFKKLTRNPETYFNDFSFEMEFDPDATAESTSDNLSELNPDVPELETAEHFYWEKNGHERSEKAMSLPTSPSKSSKHKRGHRRAESKPEHSGLFDVLFSEEESYIEQPKPRGLEKLRYSIEHQAEHNGRSVPNGETTAEVDETSAANGVSRMPPPVEKRNHRLEAAHELDFNQRLYGHYDTMTIGDAYAQQKGYAGRLSVENRMSTDRRPSSVSGGGRASVSSRSSYSSSTGGRPSVEVAGHLPFDELEKKRERHAEWHHRSGHSFDLDGEDMMQRFVKNREAAEAARETHIPKWILHLFPRLARNTSPTEDLYWFGSYKLYLWILQLGLMGVVVACSISVTVAVFHAGGNLEWILLTTAILSLFSMLFCVSGCLVYYTFCVTVTCLVDEGLVEEIIREVIETAELKLSYDGYNSGEENNREGDNAISYQFTGEYASYNHNNHGSFRNEFHRSDSFASSTSRFSISTTRQHFNRLRRRVRPQKQTTSP